MNYPLINIFNQTSGNNDSEFNDMRFPSRFGTALGALVAFAFIIFGLCGNSLIVIAIISKSTLRNNLVNLFIVSLQLNDIFNICFNCIPVALSYTFMKWHGPYILCEIFVYTSIISTGSLLWHHAIISMQRYIVVVHNQNSNMYCVKMSPKFSITFSLIISRLIPILVCAPALYSRTLTVYNSVIILRDLFS